MGIDSSVGDEPNPVFQTIFKWVFNPNGKDFPAGMKWNDEPICVGGIPPIAG
jgi:hypothetical protein